MSTIAIVHPRHITINGWMGAVLSMSLILSMWGDLRIPVAGTLMHPYLLLLPVLVVIGGLQVFRIPGPLLFCLGGYIVFFSLPMALEGSYFEILKIVAGVATLLVFVQCVRSEADFEVCMWGFIIVSVYLSARVIYLGQAGLGGPALEGINALEGLGNKNAQSQFTLPGFFFICFNLFHQLRTKKYFKAASSVSMAVIVVVGGVLTGNRSGYLGIVIVILVFIVAFRFSIRALVAFILLTMASTYLVDRLALRTFERKLEITTAEDYVSDRAREMLIRESIFAGLENPFPGLGFAGLTQELASRLNLQRRDDVDPHNLFGYLLGGGGVMTFVFFAWTFKLFSKQTIRYQRIRDRLRKRGLLNGYYDRRINIWLLGFLVLFVFRSFFTRELIYSPNFMGALGLLYGMLIYYQRRLSYAVYR
ncbi:MAG TPA: O-antigen ligase family protein [Cyclobacteriaceae bacterium]|nr:O-antigen ligase family protein [Cyclobacteriaceae bacterium]